MAIVTLDEIKQHANVDFSDDDALLTRQVAAAEAYIDRQLGYKIEATYGGADQPAVPADLVQAVCMLVAHWYLFREAATEDEAKAIPFGVDAIVKEYRDWSF